MQHDTDSMKQERWKKLMLSLGLAENISTYDSLLEAYSEKHRYYHTVKHVSVCLKWLDTVVSLAENINEIELALWFHDAVYKPYSSENELKSAVLATGFLRKNQVDKEMVQRVHDLIMSTEHTKQAKTNDESLLVDIDLTILGSEDSVYSKFEDNIRKEYKWVPYFIYRKKRIELLKSFVNRAYIFHTDYFRQKLEIQARKNLNKVISSL